jgi:hypothetical protein
VTKTATIQDQFPSSYAIFFNALSSNNDWPSLKIPIESLGAGECETFLGGINHRAVVLFPVKDRTSYISSHPLTQVFFFESSKEVGETFDSHYKGGISHKIPINATATGLRNDS